MRPPAPRSLLLFGATTDPYAALRVPDFRRFIAFLAAQTLATMMQGIAARDTHDVRARIARLGAER